jgi:hypothetical protein
VEGGGVALNFRQEFKLIKKSRAYAGLSSSTIARRFEHDSSPSRGNHISASCRLQNIFRYETPAFSLLIGRLNNLLSSYWPATKSSFFVTLYVGRQTALVLRLAVGQYYFSLAT